MFEPTPVYTNRLQCVECGRVSREDERGWTVRLTTDDEVVVYCPDCDERDSAVATTDDRGDGARHRPCGPDRLPGLPLHDEPKSS
jgi:hypothetical protein